MVAFMMPDLMDFSDLEFFVKNGEVEEQLWSHDHDLNNGILSHLRTVRAAQGKQSKRNRLIRPSVDRRSERRSLD